MWFDVDKAGLAKLLERRGREYVLLELVSNALDTDAQNIFVHINPVPRSPKVTVLVTDDDPDGFKHLSDAWTLFAESIRKGDVGKRGRFNLGEKLVLALMDEASISTTTGTVTFDDKGRHVSSRKRRDAGSVFEGKLSMTREESERALTLIGSIIVPKGRRLVVNDLQVESREPIRSIETQLLTESAGADGALRRYHRKTKVSLFRPIKGERPMLHELGIPVVELPDGDPFHVDVSQKVPVNMDRDNVSPAYLKELRVAVMNVAYDLLSKDAVEKPWAKIATSDENVSDEAVRTVSRLRFGEDAVAYDLADTEATKRAASKEITVVSGGTLSKEEWANYKRAGVLPPAGKVYPTPKPYSDDPNAPPVKVLTPKGIQIPVVEHIRRLGSHLLHRAGKPLEITVRIVDTPNNFSAAYGGRQLDLNIRRLGKKWFERIAENDRDAFHELLIHELGHEFSHDHLSEAFHDALCLLGSRLAALALEDPAALRVEVPEELLEPGVKPDRSPGDLS